MKKLLVTGASSGIGHAIAARASRDGWNVLAATHADVELRDAASIDAFSARALSWCEGHLDALVNNAGVAFAGAVEELRMDEIREQFEVNVFGHIQLTQRLLPALRDARGDVVFISSDRASAPVPLYGAYVASKRALGGFADVLASEVEAFGVRVSVLELGSYASNIRTKIRAAFDAMDASRYADLVQDMRARLGTPPMGDPDDAAAKVLALLADRRRPGG